jgi:hypothetical protein
MKRVHFLTFILSLFVFYQIGCASYTRAISGVRNSKYGDITYKKILVWFSVQNVDDEMYSESSFIQYFNDKNKSENFVSASDIHDGGLRPNITNLKTDFAPAHEIFFPGKNYTDAEIVAGLKNNGVDALLLVRYYKGASDTSVTNGFVSRGLFGSVNVNETTTKLHQIRAELIDAKSSETVWISDSEDTQLGDDYISRLAIGLVENGLIEAKLTN